METGLSSRPCEQATTRPAGPHPLSGQGQRKASVTVKRLGQVEYLQLDKVCY